MVAKNWLDCGRLKKISLLPISNSQFANAHRRTQLAGDSHHDNIRPGRIIGAGADNDGGPLLRQLDL